MILEDYFRRPSAIARYRLPPLGPLMDGFCEWLHAQGFSRDVMRRRIWQVSHFNQCLRRWGIQDCQKILASHTEQFIDRHLPHCRCRHGMRYGRRDIESTIRSVIDFLSQQGFITSGVLPTDATIPPVLQHYLDYLRRERNLAQNTIRAHRTCIAPLLDELGEPLTERIAHLLPEQLLDFFTRHTRSRPPSLSRHLQGSLRSFLRFCRQEGYLERDLTGIIPPIHSYKLSGVPRGISGADARKTLAGIDRTTSLGLRDFAIILLLHTYGVRGSQVRALRLQDIEWRDNRIRFPAAKGGKEVVVPLTDEVGNSLLDYLRDGRPAAPYPEVFLINQAPCRPLRSPSAVSVLVALHLRQAQVSPPRTGSHIFRHGFATRMLQHGQSLKTIADMLGHRHINSTFIYTKVDLKTLHQLPLDWPEVQP
ncbi:MAG: tyrosine-type recombinase/integrase [Gammaproteobacteria bacterium]|nr:tyrosine-type recombinase/integrase [Gammaproteobacteria bacterium]